MSKLKTRITNVPDVFDMLMQGLPPSILSGWIRPSLENNDFNVSVKLGKTAYKANASRTWRKEFKLIKENEEKKEWYSTGNTPIEENNIIRCKPSSSGRLIAIVRNRKDDKGPSGNGTGGQILEIWSQHSLLREIDLKSVHGDVLKDNWFGALEWSQNERYVTYVAKPQTATASAGSGWYDKEHEKVKQQSVYDKLDEPGNEKPSSNTSNESKENKSSSNELPPGTLHRLQEDWGEQFTGIGGTQIYIASIETGKVVSVPLPTKKDTHKDTLNDDDDLLDSVVSCDENSPTVGQPVFSACGKYIFYVVWWPVPRRLGSIYCFQRPCAIHAVDISRLLESFTTDMRDISDSLRTTIKNETVHFCLTHAESASRCPRPSPCGRYIAYLGSGSNRRIETHNSTFALRILHWNKWLDESKRTSQKPTNPPIPTQNLGHDISANADIFSTTVVPIFHRPVEHNKDYFQSLNEFLQLDSSDEVSFETLCKFPEGFAGVYCVSLPSSCWIHSSSTIVFSSEVQSTTRLVRVDLQHGHDFVQQVSLAIQPIETIVRNATNVIAHNLQSEDLKRYAKSMGADGWNDPTRASTALLDTYGDLALVIVSSPTLPAVLATIQLPPASASDGKTEMLPFADSTLCKPLLHHYSDIQLVHGSLAHATNNPTKMICRALLANWKVHNVNPSSFTENSAAKTNGLIKNANNFGLEVDTEASKAAEAAAQSATTGQVLCSDSFESLIIVPHQENSDPCDSDVPLVVMPHGGPHGVYPTSFAGTWSHMLLNGFGIVSVNFRGSTGFGEQSIRSLPGRCGSADVRDCMDSLMTALSIQYKDIPGFSQKESSIFSPKRISVVGGSHGGYLGAHLSAQYPSIFRAAVLRNPVIDMSTESSVTDIPDWCFVEVGASFDWDRHTPANPAQLERLWRASPVAYIDNVKAPTLLTLGAKDQRVPPSQGLIWHYALRSRGVISKTQWYPEDSHPLASPFTMADGAIHIVRWLLAYSS